jgi:type IV pilus assembly protein PilO
MELQNLPWYGQLLVFLVIGGILLGIFYFAYYSDNETRIKGITTQIETLEKQIRDLEKKQSRIKEMQAEVAAKNAVLEKLKEILPETREIAQNIKKIQAIITTARLDIQRWNTQGKRTQQFYIEHPYSINLDGNYHNLGMFFDQLSKLKKIFTVSNLTIRPASKMTRSMTIRASFVASTYTFKPPKADAAKKKGRK